MILTFLQRIIFEHGLIGTTGAEDAQLWSGHGKKGGENDVGWRGEARNGKGVGSTDDSLEP